MKYKKHIKRVFDVLFSVIGIGFFLPVMIIVSISLLFYMKSSPFFLQRRPGKNSKPFYIIKFKSMKPPILNGKVLPNKDRITKFGAFLRKSSLDEIPQLFNVLIGDMSFVGPRPLLFDYILLYSQSQKRRHEVKPGITGLAQVSGRNSITWEEKFKLDVYYVDHISPVLDIKIIWLTLLKVILREGINQNKESTMQPFKGTTNSTKLV